VHRRLCVYGDTRDEHFLIARHPTRANVAVATGGSGHAFKFAPVLGDLIADLILDDHPHPLRDKFRWRTDRDAHGAEAARHRRSGDPDSDPAGGLGERRSPI
jgi:glycine/D-amino acid oxidase-like deaminating enzyme